jgi:hypothetical protein
MLKVKSTLSFVWLGLSAFTWLHKTHGKAMFSVRLSLQSTRCLLPAKRVAVAQAEPIQDFVGRNPTQPFLMRVLR